MINSKCLLRIKSGDSVVVIGYQVDKCTHTQLAECFIAQSNIYPSLRGKVSSLTHIPHESECEKYSLFDQAVERTEHGLDSILMDSVSTLELGASFDEADAMPSSISSGFFMFG